MEIHSEVWQSSLINLSSSYPSSPHKDWYFSQEFALDPSGWHIIGDATIYNIEEIDESEFYDKIFYKDRWIKEDLSGRKIRQGAKPLEQHLIVSYSPKYKIYPDALHETAGFRTDYEILTDLSMKKVIRESKKK